MPHEVIGHPWNSILVLEFTGKISIEQALRQVADLPEDKVDEWAGERFKEIRTPPWETLMSPIIGAPRPILEEILRLVQQHKEGLIDADTLRTMLWNTSWALGDTRGSCLKESISYIGALTEFSHFSNHGNALDPWALRDLVKSLCKEQRPDLFSRVNWSQLDSWWTSRL